MKWRVVLASALGIAFGSPVLVLFSLGVFTKPLEEDLGFSRAQISLVATVFTLVSTVTFPLVGALLDRFGPRRVVLVSLPAFGGAYAMLYFLPRTPGLFYLAWAVVTFLGTGPSNAAYCKAIARWFDRRLGLAMGLAVAGQGVGAALVPALSYLLIARYGWRVAYASLGALTLAVTFSANVLFLRDGPPPPPPPPPRPRDAGAADEPAAEGLAFAEALRTTAFRRIAPAFFLLGFMSTAILGHHVPMLVDAGVTPSRAALAQVVYGVALTAGRLGVGALLDRVFAPHVLIASLTGLVLGLALYAAGTTGAGVFAAAALIGFGIGAEFDVLGFLVARYFGRRAYGKLYALVLSTFTLGGGIGVAAVGFIRSSRGSYAPGLLAIAGATVVAIVFLSRLGPYRGAAPEEPLVRPPRSWA